jgi:hypothetical protein
MADPRVRLVGQVEDSLDGMVLIVGVDYDTVTLGSGLTRWRFSCAQVEELARHIVAASWEAARQAGELAAEAVSDG